MKGSTNWMGMALAWFVVISASGFAVNSCRLFEPLDGYTDGLDAAPVIIDPSEGYFDPMNGGSQNSSVTFSLKNDSSDTVKGISVRLGKQSTADSFFLGKNACNSINLIPKEACQVAVVYAPKGTGGAQATLEVWSQGKLVASAKLEGAGFGL